MHDVTWPEAAIYIAIAFAAAYSIGQFWKSDQPMSASAIEGLIVKAAIGLVECDHKGMTRLRMGVLWCGTCGSWGEYQALGAGGVDARIELTWHVPLTHTAIDVLRSHL